MTPHFFIFWTVIACIMAAVAFLPISNTKPVGRRRLYIGATLALVPIMAKMIFSVFPLLEARMIPFDLYAAIQREFWLPFAVLFFALASHLVPSRSRKGVRAIVMLLVLVVVQETFWHLQEPEIYAYEGRITDGVCQQSAFDTCGAASMVTLLNGIGVQATEGEMARLAMAAPGKGLSPHQAAYALRRKLGAFGRSEKTTVLVPDLNDLRDLPQPFLAGIKLSFRTNHMVCVMETTQEHLVVGDPLSIGPQKWSWQTFGEKWSGIAIVCHENDDTI